MSLRIIYGRAGTGKSTYCINEIKNNLNKKTYIITPEQFSYSMERKLLESLDKKVSLQVEVISFQRLANRIFTEVGGINDIVISKSSQAMLIYHILQQEKDNLKFLGKSKENIDLILKEITELKKHNINTEKIDENIKRINYINLLGKLQDINKIYKLYENYLKNKFIDEEDILSKLSKKIEESKMFNNSVVYIDEFSGFTAQEYEILNEILKKANQVNVTICSDNLNEDTQPETDIFYYNKLFAKKIKENAKNNNIKIEEPINLEKIYRLKNEELLHLEKNIYNINPKKYLEKNNKIKIFLANNKYSELEHIAIEILKLVKNEKIQYKDISIITKNISEINSIIKVIFKKYEIPFFIDDKEEITENILIKYILSILEIFKTNWSQEAVLNYMKSGFLNLEKEEIYKVENYCNKNGIKGNKWYKKEWEENKEIQNKIITPILKLKNNLNNKTAKNISEEIYKFIKENNIVEKLNNKIKSLEKIGEKNIAKEYKASLEILIDVLDEIVEFFGDNKISFEEYKEILKIGLKNKELGQIPQFIDQVIVGDIDRTRSHKVKAIFIIGVNDGIFPSVNKNEGFFNDEDRNILKENNLEIAKNTLDNLYEDQFNIYKAFTIAEEKLYISYISVNKDGAALRPSMLINKIKNIFPEIKEESDILKKESEITNANATYEELLANIRKLVNGENIDKIWYDVYNWYNKNNYWNEKLKNNIKILKYKNTAEKINENNIKKLYGNILKTSISKLEQYKKCPFSFYLKYGLKLKEQEEYKISAMDTGSFMHEVISEFFEEAENIKQISDEEIEEIITKIIDKKLKINKNNIFTSSPKFIVLTKKLKYTITQSIKYIVYQMQNSNFKTVGNETEFNKKINNIEITGKIDRIDIAENKYIRIIDYKSSEKDIDLNQAMAGVQIQLLTYIDILSEQENKESAGILYFNLIEPIISENKNLSNEEIEEKIRKSFKMKGLILADINVIKMMDNTLEKGSSNNIPVYLDKEGNISKTRSSVVTKEQFRNLQKMIRKTINRISGEILSGKIDIKPMYNVKTKTSTCKYCEYKNICRFDSNENEYEYLGTKSKEEILEEIKERID